MSGPAGDALHERLRAFWDTDAATYDAAPGHALADPAERRAWRAALARHLPQAPASVLDVGAGTGAISLLAAELGHRVTALDLSPGMLERARAKAAAAGLELRAVVGPAHRPPPGPFDAVIERHLAWTLPDPARAFRAWRDVVAGGGRVVLYEGLWGRRSALDAVRGPIVAVARRLRRVPDDHHADYDPALRGSLPFARGVTPRALARALGEAGWSRYRVERLRDVEAARRGASPWPLGRLESVPRFAVLAER